MSQTISSTPAPIKQDNVNFLPREAIIVPKGEQTEQKAPRPTEKSGPGDFLFKALENLTGGRKLNDKKSLKAFSHLAGSLEKAFSNATRVDHKTGEDELKQGGMRRIGKDLTKLFKGMGIPPQLAKQFARSTTEAVREGGVEQIDLSMTSSRSYNIEAHQFQAGYLSDGDGTMIAGAVANSFQVSAIQTRSFDLSINLRTEEFSMEYSKSDSLSISSERTAIVTASTPSIQAPADETGLLPVESANDVAMLFQRESSLLEINRTVQHSALMQLQPATVGEEKTLSDDETSSAGLSSLQELFEKLEEVSPKAKGLFETLTLIRDLRIEKEDDDDHLRFSVEALAPVGLRATDDSGHATTLYPRPDGSLGTIADDPVDVTA